MKLKANPQARKAIFELAGDQLSALLQLGLCLRQVPEIWLQLDNPKRVATFLWEHGDSIAQPPDPPRRFHTGREVGVQTKDLPRTPEVRSYIGVFEPSLNPAAVFAAHVAPQFFFRRFGHPRLTVEIVVQTNRIRKNSLADLRELSDLKPLVEV
jgi:hypothetical protein